MADLSGLLGGNTGLDFLSGDNGNLGVGLNSDDANTLALLGAMGGVEKAGLQRTATPMGSIAQALIPLFAAPIQARQLEAQSALQGLLLKAKLVGALADLQKAGKDDSDPTMDRLHNAQAAEAEARAKNLASPYGGLAPADRGIADLLTQQGKEPTPGNIQLYKEDLHRQRQTDLANRINQQTQAGIDARRASDAQARLASPYQKLPENKGMFAINKDDLTSPKGITQGMLDDPQSPFVSISNKDRDAVIAAKQVQQQIDRLRELIPDVLPKSRIAAPISLVPQAVEGGERAEKIKEFDRLSAFEQLKGIRDFVASGRMNVPEIQGVGKITRGLDSQDSATGTLNAMENLVHQKIDAMGLNSAALSKSKLPALGLTSHASDQPPAVSLTKGAPAPMATPGRVKEVNDLIQWGIDNKIPKDQMREYLRARYGDTAVDLQ